MPFTSDETTVRQTPLTASDSPGVSSGARDVISRRRRPAGVGLTSATSPTFSTIPVNMTADVAQLRLHEQILAKPVRMAFGKRFPREPPPLEPPPPAGPDPSRRDVEVHRVHDAGLESGPAQRRTAFQHQRCQTRER